MERTNSFHGLKSTRLEDVFSRAASSESYTSTHSFVGSVDACDGMARKSYELKREILENVKSCDGIVRKSYELKREAEINKIQSPRRNAIASADIVAPAIERKVGASFPHTARKPVPPQDEYQTAFIKERDLIDRGNSSPILFNHAAGAKEAESKAPRSPISLRPLTINNDQQEKPHLDRGITSPIGLQTLSSIENKALRSPLNLRPLFNSKDDPSDKGVIPLRSPRSPISQSKWHSAKDNESQSNFKSLIGACPSGVQDLESGSWSPIPKSPVALGLEPAVCKLCGRSFIDEMVLAQHQMTSQHKRKALEAGQYSTQDKVRENDDDEFIEFTQFEDFVDNNLNPESVQCGESSTGQLDDPSELKCNETAPTTSKFSDFRWEKVKSTLIRDLSSAEADELSTIIHKISRNAEYHALASSAQSEFHENESSEAAPAWTSGNSSIETLQPEVLKALRKYLINCLSSGVSPAAWFLADSGQSSINLKGCLVSRLGSITSLCGVLEVTTWIASIDVSHNDLKASGTQTLLDAIISSLNPIRDLNIAGNNIMEHRTSRGAVDHEKSYFQPDSIVTVLGSLLESKSTLTKLNIAHNKLGDAGLQEFARAALMFDRLIDLDLSFNAGSESKRSLMNTSGMEIGRLVSKSTSLRTLNLRWNTLSGAGAVDIAQSLKLNKTITFLDLSWNSFGKCRAIDLIGQSLSNAGDGRCILKHLDLSYNVISDHKILQFSECLPANTSLTSLNLDGNPLMMAGIGAIRRAMMQYDDFQIPPTISMLHCGAESKMAETFDVTHPAGLYTLDLSEDYSRIVIKNLVQIAVEGHGEFDSRTMTLNDKPFCISLPKELPIKMLEGEAVEIPSRAEGGEQGHFSRKLAPLQRKLASLKKGSVLISGSNLPLKGILKFEFGEMTKPPVDGETMPAAILQSLITALENCEFSTAAVQAVISSFLSGRYLSSVQAVQVIASVKAMQFFGHPVVMLAIQLHGRLSDPENTNAITASLSDFESAAFVKYVGPLSFACTVNNPTGHYSLDLTKQGERDFAVRLVAWKNREALEDDKIQSLRPHVGLPKVDFDRHWRNARLNGHDHFFTPCCTMPIVGRFEIDFVQTSKPREDDQAIEDVQFEHLIEEQWRLQNREDPDLLVRVFRELSNFHFFTCKQVQRVLIEITKVAVVLSKYKVKKSILHRWTHCTLAAAFTFWRFENHSVRSFSRLVCLGNNDSDPYLYRLRAEVVITAFARIIDWHGLGPWIIAHLSVREHEELEKRLGKYNLFDEAVAVNPYTLELTNHEDRRIMQELMHLAEIEEGRNFVDIMYNEKEFTIPPGWKHDVPTKGIIRFCYCRGPEACHRINTKYHDCPSWPVGFREHCGVQWVATHRLQRVQDRLRRTFADAVSSFKKIDLDGDGILNQTEMAVGLFKMGLWLSPPEVHALVRALDVDGTNDINFDEWHRFYSARRISVSEFAQANTSNPQVNQSRHSEGPASHTHGVGTQPRGGLRGGTLHSAAGVSDPVAGGLGSARGRPQR